MFALLAPAGFALIVGVKQRLDAHAQFQAAQRREKAAKGLRGAAAGALPEAADVAEWRAKAALATQRIVGLEGILQARAGAAPPRALASPLAVAACARFLAGAGGVQTATLTRCDCASCVAHAPRAPPAR